MRSKLFLLACVAALATALPARATLVFELYRPVEQTDITLFATSNVGTPAAGQAAFAAAYIPIVAPIVLTVGQEIIVTAVLHQTDNAGADTFTDAGIRGFNQRLIGYRFGFRYLPGIAIHKSPVAGTLDPLGNTSGLSLGDFSGAPNIFSGMGDVSSPSDLTLGGYFTPSTFYALTSFRLRAVASGTGNLQIFDFAPSPSDDIGSAFTPGMDPLIFSHAPAGNVYNFPITVLAVPEPTTATLFLVGLMTAAGLVGSRRQQHATLTRQCCRG